MRWNSDYHTTIYHAEFSVNESVICGVMHEPINKISLDALPNSWTVTHDLPETPDNLCLLPCTVNCITLECNHKFHISVVAIHFALNSMRCPVCRLGHDR